jgi:hypothetical protein
MILIDREFHFYCEMTLKRSNYLQTNFHPKDDKTNWLFVKVDDRLFSFIYQICNPKVAEYDSPFTAELSFMLFNEVKELIAINQTYDVFRGFEEIGFVRITGSLNE